ncbi:hypothetical protein ABLE93_15200 [Xanthobacter sp. KR7-65]|uniref:hypothetical protein n=1 Tax=Xanthobacter sp. KR7-65 TaxID=3156612 RepID=UPI0032B3BFC3
MAGSVQAKTGNGRGNLLTVASATALIATEAFATAAAAGWALAGLFHLGDIGEWGLIGLFSLLALYITVVYARRAYRVEMTAVG